MHPESKKALMTAAIAIASVAIASWASSWYRGFLQTGGKALPTANTQG